MTKRATAGLAAGALLLAGLAAGCSGDDGDGGDNGGDSSGGDDNGGAFAEQGYAEIKQAAVEAMETLESMHVDFEVSAQEQTFATDISMSLDGRCEGSVSQGAATAELLQTEDGAWYRPNADYLAIEFPDDTAQVIRFIGDSWVTDEAGDVVAGNCDLEGFIDSISDDEDESDTSVGGVEKLDGEDVVRIDFTNAVGKGSAWVLVEGEHYIVKIETSGDQDGTAVFSAFNEEVEPKAPAADETVDLADFGA